jgi:hypothetical protein
MVYLYNHLILLNTQLGDFTVNQWLTNFFILFKKKNIKNIEKIINSII